MSLGDPILDDLNTPHGSFFPNEALDASFLDGMKFDDMVLDGDCDLT